MASAIPTNAPRAVAVTGGAGIAGLHRGRKNKDLVMRLVYPKL